jgi:sialate O-acetylesterase
MPIRVRSVCLLLALLTVRPAFGQTLQPQVWWPVQPTALPFVHSLFTDEMVFQRDVAAPIWGWSTPGDSIMVAVDGKPAGQTAVAGKDGKWQTKIGPLPAGGPHTVTVQGDKSQASFTNVLFGDVWLCSGQSNMNWPVRLSMNAEMEIKQANYPQIRSFNIGFYPSLVPMKLPPSARWEVCTPEFARNFTGVGYFFAREIHQTQKVPIGIIHSSVGATAAEAWVSPAALRKHMPFDFREALADVEQATGPDAEKYDYFAEIEKWIATVDPPSAKRRYASDPNLDTSDWLDITVPKSWKEAGLPDFDGLVWFRRTIDMPEAWAGKDLRLQLSTVHDADVTWFNGTLIGCTQLKTSLRNYRVDGRLVKPGKNLLVVAVLNKEGSGGFCSTPNSIAVGPVAGGDKPLSLAGTWKAKAPPPARTSPLRSRPRRCATTGRSPPCTTA